LDWLPCPLVIRVSRRLECGSHAAAPAALTIRRVFIPFTLMVTGTLSVLLAIILAVMNEITSILAVIRTGWQ